MSANDPNYPASFYARLFNVTERRIQQLAKEGIIPKAARGKYPLIGTIQGYVKYLQDRSLGQEFSDSDLRSEKLRLTKAQADNLELKNEMVRGQTVPTEILRIVLGTVAAETSGILDGIPLNTKRKYPEISAAAIEDIKLFCVKAQNAMARVDETLETALDDYLSDAEPAI